MKKLSKKALKESWIRWEAGYLVDMTYQWEMAFGFCDSMIPILKDLYPNNPQEVQKGLKRHSGFYCTEPQIGSIIGGVVCGLEEERANGVEIDDDTINSIKVGLMGPLAGIGDAMVPGMLIPLLLSIAVGISRDGSIIGPLFYIIAYLGAMVPISYTLFMKGYTLGTKSIDILIGETAQKVRKAINVLGAIVVGGVGASYVSLNLNFTIGAANGSKGIVANEMVNTIFPNLVPLLVILLSWWLMSKKNISSLKMILVFLIIALAGVAIGIF
ncbi:PTS system mannose/fructose/sorbose family transporter subunit IID [Candidatus Enterococcus ferrettii]|uniref:PTS system mannose/fructose/sorbose family transporter subunit IID n=1 Tax=Candidatus Enterococcus ferrettii TaxID=2815324 RepID=A0ABV0ERT2_9ENTE|nr:PTS system mannose/fructose/sorbose family transporter subunit IID [Enterococcus sp. 665A]MBO1343148.1 PTS system mannose/fructose/sorbose family transporter subunit IID [Enterococcus sp. 665A]